MRKHLSKREAAFKALLKKTQKSLTNSKCTKKEELPQSRIAAIQAPIPQVIQTKARLQQRRGAIIVLKKDIDKAKSELLCEAVLGMMSEQKEE
ncbi:hypothetical protein FGO68_gene13909 [Halteria grandinella]|uniref:Uncharacterized protein n=1 Tax=Halteria grandinella TaxID=5974 RepID=A0A8J8NUP6_HALGN|nr:hypothetical protein FGO68_gene13909 [Halteria grandinella]